jgi:hypothetical protein
MKETGLSEALFKELNTFTNCLKREGPSHNIFCDAGYNGSYVEQDPTLEEMKRAVPPDIENPFKYPNFRCEILEDNSVSFSETFTVIRLAADSQTWGSLFVSKIQFY